jgi:colanic acid/amylovoran biosynthesis glycosyltransferase
MRVAYLVNQYPKISHTFIRREIRAVEQQGFQVFRIALRGWDGELADQEDELERKRTCYVLRNGATSLALAILRMLFRRPRHLMRAATLAYRMSRGAERPLAVHLAYLAEACLILEWLTAKSIQHLHAHFGTNPAEVAMLVHELGGPPWSFTVHGPEEFDKARFIGLTEKVRRAAFVAAISSFGRSQLFRLLPYEHWCKVRVVPCGLEPTYSAAINTSTFSLARRLVCVGRLCEQKGQLLLLEAAQAVVKRGLDFELVLVGDGEMRSTIETQLVNRGLHGHVRITGWMSNDAVRNEILAARALVLPSFAEGLPIVIMEAMALRRPVISTFVAGIPELVQAGEHGWLVPPGDPVLLSEAMQECLTAPAELLERMGKAARDRVTRRHDIERAADALGKLFQSSDNQGDESVNR